MPISGYKHALVQVLCCTILFPETEFIFDNVPNILDTQILLEILIQLGATCNYLPPRLIISTKNMSSGIVPEQLSKKIHGALYLLPALLGRFGYVEIGLCGGCAIGEDSVIGNRPISHMIDVLTKAGAVIQVSDNKIVGYHKPKSGISINIQDFSDYDVLLSGPKVSGATKTAILTAITAPTGSVSLIENPYLKLDVTETLRLLTMLNHEISVSAQRITIKSNLIRRPTKVHFSLVSDISTLMTYISLAVASKKSMTVKDETISEMLNGLQAEINILEKMGIRLLQQEHSRLTVLPPKKLMPVDIEVLSTTIFSDHQPLFVLMLANATGISTVYEKVWVRRFSYVQELKKLGYQCSQIQNQLIVAPKLKAPNKGHLYAHDLRAAATLIIAACLNEGVFYLSGKEHLERGYENFIGVLKAMGAKIFEVSEKSDFHFETHVTA